MSDKVGSKVYLTAFTYLVNRPTSAKLDSKIVFGEAKAKTAPPIKVWYPVGDPMGRQFIY